MKPANLDACVDPALSRLPAFRSKRDIDRVAARIDPAPRATDRWRESAARIVIGDDTAAIPDGNGYLLLAAEGILPALLDRDPYFAGWCSVMVNVSDVAAMGGFPLALVDVYFRDGASGVEAVVTGIREASAAYGVPLVGGHTTRSDEGPHALAVAILGRADRLLPELRRARGRRSARGGRSARGLPRRLSVLERRVRAVGQRPARRSCAAGVSRGSRRRARLQGREQRWFRRDRPRCSLESSGAGGVLDLDRLPRPEHVETDRWLLTFPSYGFVLTAPPDRAGGVLALFRERGIACERVGTIDRSLQLRLAAGGREAVLWDLARHPFTGFGPLRSS